MTNSQRLAKVRTRLLRWLADQTASSESEPGHVDPEAVILSESILIRDEYYCGRRFHTATHDAVWFLEEDELKIYDGQRQLCATLSSEDIDQFESSEMPNAGGIASPESAPAILKMHSADPSSDENSEDSVRRAA